MGIVYGFFYSGMQLICKAKTIQLHSVSKKKHFMNQMEFYGVVHISVSFTSMHRPTNICMMRFSIINNPIQ